ncbi:MAG: M61 family metallopeptidase [Flavobacteriales bacterium]
MASYHVSIHSVSGKLIAIEATFNVAKKTTMVLQLPAWRPGRYELGNFAKNIQQINFYNEKNEPLGFRKTTRDQWEIHCTGSKKVIAVYTYSATELNAGSSFIDENQLYVNPVNCFLYPADSIHESCSLELYLPWKKYDVATSLSKKGNTWMASDFHEMADSPFIASPHLKSFSFKVKHLPVTVWIMGECQADEKRIREDFTRFTKKQLDVFGDCPAKKYHYLLQITPGLFYHGVEHLQSTVIALGPGSEIMQGRYDELLGVSCHEFYHAWNIKSIRPVEMFPYDYTRENYFETGYVAEGVTTYMGDLILWQSEVFSDEQYVRELNAQIQKHADNPGRFNYSVAQSSFDMWIDGYTPGVAGRKVSIYTEGCLLALCADLMILKNTGNKSSLHTAMKMMYTNFYKKKKGYSVQDYKKVLEKVSGLKLDWYFEEYLHGTSDYFKLLNDCLDYVGFELASTPASLPNERYFGFKIQETPEISVVSVIYPGSPADEKITALCKIVAVNKQMVKGDATRLIAANGNKPVHLTVSVADIIKDVVLTPSKKEYYSIWRFTQQEKVSAVQRKNYLAWKKGI